MAFDLSKSPLAYKGVRATTPPNTVVVKRHPTTNDVQGFTIGDLWLYMDVNNPASSILYVLAGVSQSVATWVPLKGGSGGGSSVNVRAFTTLGAGTYTPTAGMTSCIVECVGGGGGGGKSSNSGESVGTGGGAGGYCKKSFSSSTIGSSVSFVIGAGGSGDPVSDGEDTTFSSFLTAGKGLKGQDSHIGYTGGSGGTCSGGDINITGQSGGSAYVAGFGVDNAYLSGSGGSTIYGSGGPGQYAYSLSSGPSFGVDATGYGAGGGGAAVQSGPALAGGAGAPGIIIVTEYLS